MIWDFFATMDWQKVCQITLLLLLVLGMFVNIKRDIEGHTREPSGFRGVVFTLVFAILGGCLYYFAGAFSKLF